jgi:hypothetical protein
MHQPPEKKMVLIWFGLVVVMVVIVNGDDRKVLEREQVWMEGGWGGRDKFCGFFPQLSFLAGF